MEAFIEPQQSNVLLDVGYTVEVHVTSDSDTSDVLDIRDFPSFADALLWAQVEGFEVCVYQSQ